MKTFANKRFKVPRIFLILLLICLLASCKDNRALVVGKVKKASKLATTEFTIDKIVYGIQRKRFLWVVKLKDAKFIAYSKAIVKAGVNLEKLKKEDVQIEGSRITLLLPPVEVINFSYPADSFRMDELISEDGILNRITLEEQEEFFQNAEIDIRNNLKFMDIVSTTEKNTRLLLENLLKALGYKEIYIDFKKGELIPEIELEEAVEG